MPSIISSVSLMSDQPDNFWLIKKHISGALGYTFNSLQKIHALFLLGCVPAVV
jgi:hypothetical protein